MLHYRVIRSSASVSISRSSVLPFTHPSSLDPIPLPILLHPPVRPVGPAHPHLISRFSPFPGLEAERPLRQFQAEFACITR